MKEINQQNTRVHNTVLAIMTVASIGTIIESVTQGWEYWVPILIVAGLISSWFLHILQYRQRVFRENYYLVFSMMLAFYHGVHETSTFDIVVVSLLLMITATLLRRNEFLNYLLIEFFFLIILRVSRSAMSGLIEFDSLTVSRLILHCITEINAYLVLRAVIRSNRDDTGELERMNEERKSERSDMEDFLTNISHELRTPVNVINGLSTLIMKKEERDDVASICDAGFRMARQIEDIQDYSEIQRGDVILEENKYDIASMINDIIAGYSFYQKDREKDLIVDLDPNTPSVLMGDSRRISKILGHLLDNAFKFTHRGGVYLRLTTMDHGDVTNLVIEVTDTGVGMTADEIEKINNGMYQSNRTRSRSTGGIGLGLPIVYGFVRRMNGFVSIDSVKGKGTTVRVSVAQVVVDPTPCLRIDSDKFFNVIYHLDPKNYRDSRVWELYREMAVNTASDLRINMYFAPTAADVEKMIARGDITNIFMGEKEYLADPAFYDRISKKVTVAVSTTGDNITKNGNIIVMPRPLYGYPIVRVLNGEGGILQPAASASERPVLDNVRALVVDDEPLNLIVAKGLFSEYNMIVDTAKSGPEAIQKYTDNDYDVVFMDHMMPKMDGVEAMKRIMDVAFQQQKTARVVALTANVVSGAREMFAREGFAGFIGKPINISEFERTMRTVLPKGASGSDDEGGRE
ncbi:MAG: hybrid sensor histidine kinase/response regulator [Lachnospiraceae bacterium]|nr:hybrid sensor histidine kinase/response regulator [Lachnospiraceae bacterium]